MIKHRYGPIMGAIAYRALKLPEELDPEDVGAFCPADVLFSLTEVEQSSTFSRVLLKKFEDQGIVVFGWNNDAW
jgi:hypothetical protein